MARRNRCPVRSSIHQRWKRIWIAFTNAATSTARLIARGAQVLVRKAYGRASDSPPIPATPETEFDLGSISKQFTATAILNLVEEGKLRLSDPVSRFFPEAPPDKAALTLHQLLTHTSGLTEHSTDDLEPLTRAEALDPIFHSSLAFEPGQRYRYSNSGYTLAAAIVEVQPFAEHLRQAFFDPVGMVHTGFYREARWQALPVAHGFFNGNDSGSPATWPGPYWGPMGNGEVLSTVDDMHAWITALLAGRVVSQKAVAQLFEPHVREDNETSYGYGWSVATSPLGRVITHNGGGIGGSADVAFYPDQELPIVVLSNRIWYREFHGVYLRVSIPATELREALETAIVTQSYETLPSAKLSGWIVPTGALIVMLAVALFGRWLVRRRRTTVAEARVD